ncbi:hypothetical protein D1007_58731 [Hordeum vulgare]|nr:hypothetical protein D1007_58731 [Hordeum vulgare]
MPGIGTEVITKECWLDLIEHQSFTKVNQKALFAWIRAWYLDRILCGSDFNMLNCPDAARSWLSLLEGISVEAGKEGPHFPVLIQMDVVKDYTPIPSSSG